MPQFPPDMFDAPPPDLQRVGAHRSPGRRGGGWVAFAWAALATGVLVAIGVGGISFANGQATDGTVIGDAYATPSSTVTAVTDPRTLPTSRAVTITVLNATSHVRLQNTATKALRAAHWDVASYADATTQDLTSTVVYYRDAADADVAAGVVEALGTGTAVYTQTLTFGATLEVALGEDYYTSTQSSNG